MLQRVFGHHEFWHPRIFELPFYLYLLIQCCVRGVSLRGLAKANFALDHGEIGLGSKYVSQRVFPSEYFPATVYMDENISPADRLAKAQEFALSNGFPLILKPDIGMVGKGLLKIRDDEELKAKVSSLKVSHLLQAYCDYPLEFGVFYVRTGGSARITGINQKHYPSVTGDGRNTLEALALAHPRFNRHWSSFLSYHDLQRVPKKGEHVVLSFVGSHTLGCMFTDDTDLLSDQLTDAVLGVFAETPGFNYGRLDIKSSSIEDLKRGEFVVIEVNGVSSLPTHMFDPKYSLQQSYQHFFTHARHLVCAAKEQRHRQMPLMSLLDIARHIRSAKTELEALHSNQLVNAES